MEKNVKVKMLINLDERNDKQEIKIEGNKLSILFAFCKLIKVIIDNNVVSISTLKEIINRYLKAIEKGEC